MNDIPVRLTPESRLQLVTTSHICETIERSIKYDTWKECITLAGAPITVERIGEVLGKKIIYADELQTQEYNIETQTDKTSEDFLREFCNA